MKDRLHCMTCELLEYSTLHACMTPHRMHRLTAGAGLPARRGPSLLRHPRPNPLPHPANRLLHTSESLDPPPQPHLPPVRIFTQSACISPQSTSAFPPSLEASQQRTMLEMNGLVWTCLLTLAAFNIHLTPTIYSSYARPAASYTPPTHRPNSLLLNFTFKIPTQWARISPPPAAPPL